MGAATTRRARVLVIEDDDDLCELLRETLADAGYAVATVPDGAAALEMLKQHRAAVILLDLRMPVMDGPSFIEEYRRTAEPVASFIVVSAVIDGEEQAKRLDATAFVRKPFQLDELLAVVQRCVSDS